MTYKLILGLALTLLFGLAACNTNVLLAQPYDLSWYTIDGGGGSSAGGNFDLQGTIGQYDAGTAMSGGNFEVAGGFWAAGTSGGGGPVCASDGTLIEGFGQIGDFNDTCGSDDSYWAAHGASLFFQVADPVVQFELTATAPNGVGGGTISVDIEASKQNNNGNLILRAQLFNFDSGSYVALPGILALTTSDQVQNFTLPGGSDPADFIEPGTNEVRLLLQTIQTSGLPNVRTQLDEVLFNIN